MLQSIKSDGGFYIGRYEVGSFDNPVTAEDTARKAVIQKGAYPYNYVTCSQAQKLSEGLSIGDKKCNLMFGIQWDLVCRFLDENAIELGNTPEERREKIKSDSSTWGNYYNSEFWITSTAKYALFNPQESTLTDWVEIKGNYRKQSFEDRKVILTTGATKRNSVLNIFDIAGNMMEWTLEKGINGNPIKRGGNAYDDGYVAVRNSTVSTISSGIGFRAVLY